VTDESSTGVDETVPHSARIWNYWLGGTDNLPVDREAGDAWVAVQPQIIPIARASRAFLGRAVRYLAGEAKIRQFLDVGGGLPAAENTHQIAQRIAPDARVVYVDNDPEVLAQARTMLADASPDATRYVSADLHDPDAVLAGAAEILDLDQPVAVHFNGVLGHVGDLAAARAAVSGLMDRLPSGSYLTICDGTEEHLDEATAKAQDEYADTGAMAYRNRPKAELESLFAGLEFVDPGFGQIVRWRPEEPEDPAALEQYGGVARKP
jgi:O-methyltransferase involved in polyketide biosynthesis